MPRGALTLGGVLFLTVLISGTGGPLVPAHWAPSPLGGGMAVGGNSPSPQTVPAPCIPSGRGTVECSTPTAATPVPASPSSTPPWTNLSGQVTGAPSPRGEYALAYDPADQYMVLFGGATTVFGAPMNETWTYAHGAWHQLNTVSAPAPRRSAGLTYDPIEGYLVLFGGLDPSGAGGFRDTWTFAGGEWADRTPHPLNATNSPSARWHTMMAYDPTDQYILLFGGCAALGCASTRNDTWTYANGNWTDRTAAVGTAPPARGTGSMTWYPAIGRMILYGGSLPSADHFNDTWEYVAGNWTEWSGAVNPGRRGNAFLAYDAVDGYLVLFGGQLELSPGNSVAANDTWIFTPYGWTDLTANISRAPSPRWGWNTDCYDPLDGYAIMFGDSDNANNPHNDTWAFHWPVTATLTKTRTWVDENQSVGLVARASGGSLNYTYGYLGLPTGCAPGNLTQFQCRFPTPGAFRIELIVNDSVGIEGTANLSFVVNATLTVSGSVSPGIVGLGSPVTFQTRAANGSPGRTFTYSNLPPGCAPSNVANLTCTPTISGNFTSSVRVTDGAGASANWSGFRVEVQPLAPLAATATASVSVGDSPLNVTLRGQAAGGQAPYTYAWAFGDLDTSTAAVSTHEYRSSSTTVFHATLQVLDGLGGVAVTTVNVTVYPTPRLTLTASPRNDTNGTSLALSATLTGGAPGPSYSWSGLPPGCLGANRSTLSCTPDRIGNYTVQLLATDPVGGQARAMVAVEVVGSAVHPTTGNQSAPAAGVPLILWVPIAVGAIVVVVVIAEWIARRRAPPEPPQ